MDVAFQRIAQEGSSPCKQIELSVMHVYKKNKAVMTNRVIFREFSSSIIYNSFIRLASKIYFTVHIKMKDEEVTFQMPLKIAIVITSLLLSFHFFPLHRIYTDNCTELSVQPDKIHYKKNHRNTDRY